MKDSYELMNLIEKHLEDGLGDLWDSLTPEERDVVFPRLITEYVGANY